MYQEVIAQYSNLSFYLIAALAICLIAYFQFKLPKMNRFVPALAGGLFLTFGALFIQSAAFASGAPPPESGHHEATMFQYFFAIAVFIIAYALIILEKINRAVSAMVGAVLMVLGGIFNQLKAFHAVDWNTIGLLVGMMIIVAITTKTGVFQYMAIYSAKFAKGDPWKIMILFAIITAVASAFLDNVTTVILIAPVTLVIAETLEIDPIPFLMTEVIFSNVGGTATLIGDPPNIMIGSAAHLSFMDFMINLAPLVVIVGAVTMVMIYFIYGRHLKVDPDVQARIMDFKEKESLKDTKLLKKCLFVLGVTILGFMAHGALHLEPATVALTGAGLLMLIMGGDHHEVDHALEKVEWVTIFFFMGLFIIVHGIQEVGVIKQLADAMMDLTQGDVATASIFTLWLSAIASAAIDNIPFTATMIPLIQELGADGMNTVPLWWSLALGACFGGNGSLIGATANVVVAGISTKSGYPISFVYFFKIGFPLMIVSVIMATGYVWLRYLLPLA